MTASSSRDFQLLTEVNFEAQKKPPKSSILPHLEMADSEISWETVKDNGARLLFDSHNSTRVPVLRKISATLAAGASLAPEEKLALQKTALLVFRTYNYYQDSQSRAAALQVVVDFVNFDPVYVKFFVKSIGDVAGQCSNMAVTDVLTLLAWTNTLVRFAATKAEGTFSLDQLTADPVFGPLVDAQIALLYAATNSASTRVSSTHHAAHQKRILSSSTAQTKHAIVDVLGTLPYASKVPFVDFCIARATSSSVAVSAPTLFLGVLADALHDMLPVEPSLFDHVKNTPLNEKVVSYFANTVLLAKSAPTSHALATFTRFYVANFVTADQFAAAVLPSLDKAIMRSSEVGFCHLTQPLFATADCVDLSTTFASSKLLTHTLNGLKSTKDNVRQSAFATLELVFAHTLPSIVDADVCKVVDEVAKTFKGTTNVESKILLAQAFGIIGHSTEGVTEKIISALLPLTAKEQNENVLSGLVRVLSREYILALSHAWAVAEDAKIASQFKAGFEHAKLPLRSIWAAFFGSSILAVKNISESPKVLDALRTLYPSLVKSLTEANKSPLLTVSNKAIVPAYVCIALSDLIGSSEADTAKVFRESLDTSKDKFSILTSPQVIVKLSGPEQEWCARALVPAFKYSEDSVDYAFSYLHFAISANVSYATRISAVKQISTLLEIDEKRASTVLISAIYSVLSLNESDSSDIDFGHELKYLSPIFNHLSQFSNKTLVTENLVKLVVAAHHPQIPIKENWIGLALRASIDPGNVVKSHVQVMIESTLSTLETAQIDGPLFKAALRAINTMSFIDANSVQPEIAKALKSDLNVENIADVDETSVKIWAAADGELVVDVLQSTKPKKAEDKNSKDYETRKWEESLQKEISSKKTVQKKLTREEQAQVNAQLSKESVIRSNLKAVVRRYYRAFYIIRELCSGSGSISDGGSEWFSVSVFELLKLLKHDFSFELFGEFAAETYIKASHVCRDRLHPLEEITGAVTLRLLNVRGIPENYTQLPLLQALSTVLFRIKFMVDDWFHVNGYIYIAPLVTEILNVGIAVAKRNSKKQVVTSEFSDEDPEEEHLSLALSILSAQDMLQHEQVPREPILKSMIALMKIPAKAKMAKECFSTLCQQISVNFTRKDLDVFLGNLLTPDTFVKTAILQGIDAEFDLTEELSYSDEIWITMHDNDEKAADLAKTIWEDSDFKLVPDAFERLLQFIDEEDSGLRLTVAKSMASAVKILNETDGSIYPKALDSLIAVYREKEIPPVPEKDQFGLVINKHASQKDSWEPRSTVAIALRLLSPLCKSNEAVEKIFKFLVSDESLGDKEDLVAQELLEAGTEIKVPKKQDKIKESVIILYGSLGRYLDPSDERLRIICDRLLKTLDTPSEDVQYAVSECIAPLVKSFDSSLQDRFDALFEKLWNGKSLAVRKGAAYGIAGLVKGAGIKSLFNNDVMRNLTSAAEDKKNSNSREGVSFVLECLSQSLGPMFEPYVVEVLPIILKFLGDSNAEVREATDYASRSIMKSTTSYGVKQLIPLAIRNLDDTAWRSKKGSVELLGSMAYLDPTQLSASLSTIVPEIVGVLNDSHKEVRKAADQSLKRFGEVIRNPEIQTIVPELIKAIGDPTKYTDEALDRLIKTQFVHYIDGPSLALIIHVIHRGMRERSASTKKKACQIVGNMAILVDSHDLLPYLPSLVAELEVAMVDPVPETRSTGARALGSLVEKLGEEKFPDLIPRLLDTLNDPSKAGDRLGSAQALSEVICGLGLVKLDEMLPTILSCAQSPYSHVRAGFMPLLLYLPVCFGSQFSPYLSKIIPPILQGLAETDEEIRGTALKAGRLLVKNYASKAVDLLLPELEQGLADSSYRIRLSSVELTGDLLFQVTGISGKNELSEEQVQVNKNLVSTLGQDRRDRILAALYVCRSDVTSVVRSAAIDIWKALVSNTPRTVKEIIPSLTQMLVKRLGSSDETHRTIAATTLGDVVRRVGANALSQLLPTLEELLISSDSNAKEGICIALTELINSASNDAVVSFQQTFIKIIRDALLDPSSEVRGAAAQAFEALQEQLGKVVIDEILPHLLNMLDSDDSENALLALQDIMATKSDVIFPILIPTLLSPPIDAFKAKALSSLASVAGPVLYSRLASIINTLLQAVIDTKENGTPQELEEVQEAFDKTLLSIDSDQGVHPVMQQLMSLVKHQDPAKRAAICERLAVFFPETTLDYSIYVQDIVSQLIYYLGDKDQNVVKGVFEALSALVKVQDKSVLEQLVKPAHQALIIAGVRGEDLAGFALPKGPSCVLPIFSHGLMYGNSEQKELSALSIAEIIDRTPAANLRPFATPITGPLIRVIGEKVSSDIKSAILSALTNLLRRIPQFLRPFIPQLQRTFVRSLSDPTNEKLRNGAVDALGLLIEFQPRVDSLVTELVTGAKNAEDQGIKNSLLKAMLQVVLKGGKNMSETSKTSIMALVEEELSIVNDKSAVAYARLLGSLSQILSTEEAANILKNKILSKRGDETSLKFAILSINSFLRDAPVHVFNTGLLDEIVQFVLECSDARTPYISDNATVALGKLALLHGEKKSPKQSGPETTQTPFNVPESLRAVVVEQLSKSAIKPESGSNDTRRLALVAIRTVARIKFDAFIQTNFNVVAPAVFACLRDAVIPIRLAAEKAYLAVFQLIEDVDQKIFTSWFEEASKGTISTVFGAVIQPRSIGDYTKRVASRLASVERERLEDGGDDETMFSDRYEDENEVWAVGGF
ncbi:hypothetical protein JCM33374_g4434 [Metschnikowia sp. JCM 33374]|nr:hypothetical protein JCM33374_g4434 [Metschnikowia sp. JCM 33374]